MSVPAENARGGCWLLRRGTDKVDWFGPTNYNP